MFGFLTAIGLVIVIGLCRSIANNGVKPSFFCLGIELVIAVAASTFFYVHELNEAAHKAEHAAKEAKAENAANVDQIVEAEHAAKSLLTDKSFAATQVYAVCLVAILLLLMLHLAYEVEEAKGKKYRRAKKLVATDALDTGSDLLAWFFGLIIFLVASNGLGIGALIFYLYHIKPTL